ncbi:hypothetical protein ACO2Q8_01985 [Larkinella sp. VNQ87]|uniref:hypothetical protein n=1 Tax=Larkinella sp. VNQ87 TaxID=3400921 RepID=UPI003C0FA8FE
MLLVFSVLQPDGEIRPLVFYSHQLEGCLDVLNNFIKSGNSVLYAAIREPNGTETIIPVETLDGHSMSEYLLKIQIEWEQILNKK